MKKVPGLSWVEFERSIRHAPKEEINICYYYEYAREVPSICEGIQNARMIIPSMFGTDLTSLNDPVLVAPEHPEFFLNYPEWPSTPYFSIDPAIRAKRLKTLVQDERSDEVLAKRLQPPLGIANPNLWPEVTVSIPFYHTHEQLTESFGAYLRLHFPLQGKFEKKRRGKIKIGDPQGGGAEVRTQRNALQALRVYRLRKTMTAAQVLNLLESLGQRPYSSESALNRAKALAIKHLTSFEELGASAFE